MKAIAIILIIIGVIMMVYTGFNYITTERVVDMGPIHISHDENHLVQWSPIIGSILLVGGIVIVAFDKKAHA
jgi:uncharacterized membrane protein YidH (DUF202 family)